MSDVDAEPPHAYLDRWWLAVGDSVSLMVSSKAEAAVTARRLSERAADGGLWGDAEAALGVAEASPHRRALGSYVRVAHSPEFALRALSIQAWLLPAPGLERLRGILANWRDGRGYGLFLDEQGDLVLGVGGEEGSILIGTERRLEPGVWHFVAASLGRSGEAVVMHRPVQRWPGDSAVVREAHCAVAPAPPRDVDLLLGAFLASEAGDERVHGHLDGKIDRPKLFGRALSRSELDALGDPAAGKVRWQAGRGAALGDAVVAAWDFGRDFATDRVADASPNGHHGRRHGLATRAVTGFNWRGGPWTTPRPHTSMAPFTFEPPPQRIRDGRWRCNSTCSRRAPTRSRSALVEAPPRYRCWWPAAVWLPTFSYELHRQLSRGDRGVDPAADRGADDAVLISARTPWRGLLRNLPLLSRDLDLLAFLDREVIAYRVICDHQVQQEAAAAFAGVEVALIGRQPAFASGAILDALEAYLGAGGALAYLGGGGFRWVCSPLQQDRGGLELRVAPAPGESHHSSTGELGGTWRQRGRPPEGLLGVGHAGSMEGGDAVSYRRTAASHAERFAPLFADIDGDSFSGWWPAAARVPVDRCSPTDGTPLSATVLARAAAPSGDLSADMTWLEYEGGGGVFSVGSSAWISSLSDPHSYASRITSRVLSWLLRRSH